MTAATTQELLYACLVLPLAVTNLKARVNGLIMCSDASTIGGGCCASSGVRSPELLYQSASRVALSRMPLLVQGFVHCEPSEEARRLVRVHWPGVSQLSSSADLQYEQMRAIGNCKTYDSSIYLVLFVGQSPVLKLEGTPQDSLFLEVIRVRDLCDKLFRTKVLWVIENLDELQEGFLEPHGIDAKDFTSNGGLKHEVKVSCQRLPASDWVDAGWARTAECELPGFCRAGVRKKQPARSRGIDLATGDDVQGWKLHEFAFLLNSLPGNTCWCTTLIKLGELLALREREREREKLMGFDMVHFCC
eukprot:3116235-Amphidinium_carterae.1